MSKRKWYDSKMRLSLSLLGLVAAGVALLVVPPPYLRFVATQGQTKWISLWLATLGGFGVPFCLLILSWGKNKFGKSCSIFWGAWVATLSLGVMVKAPNLTPSYNFLTLLFLTGVLLTSLAVVAFGMMGLRTLPRKENAEETSQRSRQAA